MPSTPFIGQIMMVPYNFAPRGWAFCNGQVMLISQNTALFSLLGNAYGGDGSLTFALPNLLGRAPTFFGQGPGLSPYALGQTGGEESHALTVAEMPSHKHAAGAVNSGGGQGSPQSNTWAAASKGHPPAYTADTTPANLVDMGSQAIGQTGGNQPHNNMSPYLTVSFVIALTGLFPPRN